MNETSTTPYPKYEEPPVLSSAVSLSAVGAMLLVAAVGLIVFMTSGMGHAAGVAVLVSIGVIILIAGGTLIYAALKGQRAGWFLPFTIVGAIIAMPILLGGFGMAAYPGEPVSWEHSYSYPVEEDWGYEEEGWAYEEDSWAGTEHGGHWQGEPHFQPQERRVLDPNVDVINVSNEAVLLDLTQVPPGTKLRYQVNLQNAELFVLATDKQRIEVPSSEVWDGSWIDAVAPTHFDGSDEQLNEWVNSGFSQDMMPWSANPKTATSAVFSMDLFGASNVRFVFLGENTGAHGHHGGPQSGASDSRDGNN